MSNSYFIPTILALLLGVSVIWIYFDISLLWQESKVKSKRIQNIARFGKSRGGFSRTSRDTFLKLDNQILRLGEVAVQKKYKQILQDLAGQVGDNADNLLERIVKQKIYFVIAGLLMSFLLLVERQWIFLPVAVMTTFVSYFAPNVFILLRKAAKSSYGQKLLNAAAVSGLNRKFVERIFLIKFVLSLATFLFNYLYFILKTNSPSALIYCIIAVLISFFVPDILLYNRVLKRRAQFENDLPDSIDLLSMCVSSGLAFPAALAKVAEFQTGPVSEEFTRLNIEVQLGKDRNEAFKEMSMRLKLRSLDEFVNAVGQVDRFGIPISRALKEQTRELRADRRARSREKAQKIPVKILGPVMLCFLPCVLMIVLAPALIGIFTSF